MFQLIPISRALELNTKRLLSYYKVIRHQSIEFWGGYNERCECYACHPVVFQKERPEMCIRVFRWAIKFELDEREHVER